MRALHRAARAGCIVALVCGGLANAAGAETLADAIALAYETNPTLQAERAQLRATDEEYPQAASALRPTVGASAAPGPDEPNSRTMLLSSLRPVNGSMSSRSKFFTAGPTSSIDMR